MLPDLDRIKWADIQHAYGPAEDVPDILRGMLDAELAAAAFNEFDSAVNHQGWATAAAVQCLPWLVAALDEPGAPVAELTRRLADLAVFGNHESWLGERFVIETEPELYLPVEAAHPAFVHMLSDDDADVRANAALAIAVLRTRADEALPALRNALAVEKKSAVKASMMLALGVLGTHADLDAIAAASTGKRVARVVQVAAVCSRVWLCPDVSTDDLLDLLLVEADSRNVRTLPWGSGSLHDIALPVVMAALATKVDDLRLTEILGVVDAKVAIRIADLLVKRAFPPGTRYGSVDELGDAQRTALGLAAELELRNTDTLRDAGLPRNPRAIRVFLGLEPGGVLDRPLAFDGRTIPLWRALFAAIHDELRTDEVATAVAEQFGLDPTIAAITELLGPQKYHYADVVRIMPTVGFAHEDKPVTNSASEPMAGLLAALLRPHGEAARPFAEGALESMLAVAYPPVVETTMWLTVLARLGPLDARWDPIVGNRLAGPPAARCSSLLGEVLCTIPSDRRNAIVLAQPLIVFSGSTTKSGGEIIFEWHRGWANEPWWYLWACPTPEALAALIDAVRAWSSLPPLPNPADIPKHCYAQPHAPFPFRRAEETFAHWDKTAVRAALEAVAREPEVDAAIVARLLAMV